MSVLFGQLEQSLLSMDSVSHEQHVIAHVLKLASNHS